MSKYVFHDILKVLKLILIWQRIIAVLITLTPGRRKEFINGQKFNVRTAVLPIMDVKTGWNSILETLKWVFRLRELAYERLKIP